jgi:membrane protease YdiL (CAAX protease family)
MNLEENAQNVTTEVPPVRRPSPLASIAWWVHTVVLIVILLGVSFLGARAQHAHAHRPRQIVFYILTMGWEWLMVGYIVFGIRKRGMRLRDLIAGRWQSGVEVARDFGIALAFWVVSLFVLGTIAKVLGLGGAGAIGDVKDKFGPLIPHSVGELLLFILVSMTAGFCEEVIFRGYLQRQFAAFTRSEGIAIVLQAIIFGLGHGYQGTARMVLITVYGVMFGLLAFWRKSLRPGMISHAWQDSVSGIALYFIFVVMKR